MGIDPGYAILGYGVLETGQGNRPRPLDYGVIETAAGEPFPQLLETFQPQAVAFEELFFYRNVTTALQVGAGRGVALLAAQQAGLPLYEYTPMQIKQAVCGNGHADKRQIQQMVKLLLGLRELPKPDDAADALGVAICHANTMGPMAETFRIH